ncbi:hypothetical protein K501DRAFT_222983 [Backusella circina FSU 941]|nr:hypothetical protein K501DRAFT_222983 [Backusella circina FSU 941]
MASEEQIANFCAITDTSPEEAQTYLQLADGDLQQAITLYMEGGLGPNISQAAQTSTPRNEQNTAMTDEELARQLQEDDQVRAPIAAKHDILAGGGGPSSSWTPRETVPPIRSSIFNQGDSTSGSVADFMSRLHQQPTPSGGSSLSGSPDLGNSNSSPSSKAKRLADLFRPPFDIMFHGTFEEAREDAKERNKWLLINIQDPTEFSCQVLNRDLWSDSFIKDIIKASFIFLQYANTSPDGQRYRTFYQIMNFPHIAVIDARTGERVKMWERDMKPTDFMMEVTEFLEQHEGTPSTMKRPRKMKVTEMTEEEQLNAAIAASLGSPSKEAPTPENDTPMETSQESVQQATPQPEEEVEKAGSLFDSIKPVKREETKDMANSTRVQLRMPDGKRLVRRILKTDPVLYLFEYVKAEVPEAENQQFELVFNRTQLIDVLDQSIAEAGLTNAAVNCVFV